MTGALSLYTAVVKDVRTVADLALEHSEASARINQPHPYYSAQILPRDLLREKAEREAATARLDSYRDRAFQAAEAANDFHWSE